MNRRYKVRLELEVDSEAELESREGWHLHVLRLPQGRTGNDFRVHAQMRTDRPGERWKEVKWAAVGAGNGPGASSSAAVTSHSTLKF